MPGAPPFLHSVGYVRSAQGAKAKPERDDHRLFDNRAGFSFSPARRSVTFHADMNNPFSGLGKLYISAVGCKHWNIHLKSMSSDNRL
jgi:hypothetical protein